MKLSEASSELSKELTVNGWPEWLSAVAVSRKEILVYVSEENKAVPAFYGGYPVKTIISGKFGPINAET